MSWDVVNRISRYISANARSFTTSGKVYTKTAYGTGTTDIVTVTASNSANTFGSWAEIEDSLSADSILWNLIIGWANFDTIGVTLEIGTGGAGSEVALFRQSFPATSTTNNYSFSVMLPNIKLAAGTRLAARLATTEAVANTAYVSVNWLQGTEAI